MTSRVVRPPGSRCATPGANAGSIPSRVVASDQDWRIAVRGDRAHRPLDGAHGIVTPGDGDVARVEQPIGARHVHEGLGPRVRRVRMEGLADQRRRFRRPA
ncbi:MAG TPA: hypothetical protein PKK95_12830 [Vicinamibacterales bacterium]|nr:hypothetical protein [Vicinamibacterales bacterium]